MGLLDDAIREHLELKRQRGADPSEVARDERAALGPLEDESGEEEYGLEESDFAEDDDGLGDYDEEPPAAGGADRIGGEADRSAGSELPRSSEETMEVDMRTIIDADGGRDDGELELNGDAMAASAAGSNDTSGEWGIDSDPDDLEARERRWWPRARPLRALGLG